MRRRTFLVGLGGATASLAGCAGVSPPRADRDPTRTPEATVTEVPLAAQGFPSTVCEEEVNEEFHIRAIVEPAFGDDWSGLDIDSKYIRNGDGLSASMTVVGLEAVDRARAYPLSVLWSHEIVNDDFGGPVMVTYCSLCRSGMVAERTVQGEGTVFGVSGLLWQAPEVNVRAAEQDGDVSGATVNESDVDIRSSGNPVMYDEATRSYWSQILATAICGPMEGKDLALVPSTLTTWGEWRGDHPDTDLLLPPPHSTLM